MSSERIVSSTTWTLIQEYYISKVGVFDTYKDNYLSTLLNWIAVRSYVKQKMKKMRTTNEENCFQTL